MEKTSAPADLRAIIVSIDLLRTNQDNLEQFNSSEFIELARSSGLKVEHHIFSKQNFVSASHFLTKGKADELKDIVESENIKLVVLDCELSPSQERNLEKLLCARVLDRTGLILDIFAARAQSDIGKLQVELAQLSFLSTRLVRGWSHLERQKGGIGLRGPGETQLETDRRLVSKRISVLRKKIKKIYKHRDLMRNKRTKNSIPNVAIVGYTNAGKSSIMQALCKRTPTIADRPFETLDTTTGKIWVKDSLHYSITDTVGFFSNLPLELVSAFKATIEEIVGTDILLHVIDSSNNNIKYQIDSVFSAMLDLGISDKPILNILNKSDINNLINTENLEKLINSKFKHSLGVIKASAINKTGIDEIQKLLKYELFGITV